MCENRYTIRLFTDITDDTLPHIVDSVKDVPDGSDLVIQICSCGGFVYTAYGIIDYLNARHFHTIAQVFGVAASAAALVAISCDVVEMAEFSTMMLHSVYNPTGVKDKGVTRGNDVQLDIIHRRCKSITLKELTQPHDMWLSAAECVKLGLADSIIDDKNSYVDACIAYLAQAKANYINSNSICIGDQKMDEIKLKENEGQELEHKNEEGEIMESNEPSLTDIIEALAERVDRLEARIGELENYKNDCGGGGESDEDKARARMKALYAKVCKPVVSSPVQYKNETQQQKDELESFKTRINIKEFLR